MTDQAQEPVFAIQRVYLKDLSLEIPHAPGLFYGQQEPLQVELQLDIQGEKVVQDVYESIVTVTVTTRSGDKVAFLVEAKQAGLFEVRNVPEEHMGELLNVNCPNIVYPYLRAAVADVVQRAGFPPIHLQEINFAGLYLQRLQQESAAAGAKPDAPAGIILPGGRH